VFIESFPSQASQPVALYDLGFYGQDEWRVKPNLKLTFSLHGEHFSDPVLDLRRFNPFACFRHESAREGRFANQATGQMALNEMPVATQSHSVVDLHF